jgi:hypothetical protein
MMSKGLYCIRVFVYSCMPIYIYIYIAHIHFLCVIASMLCYSDVVIQR